MESYLNWELKVNWVSVNTASGKLMMNRGKTALSTADFFEFQLW